MGIGREGFVRRRIQGRVLTHTYTRQRRTQVAYDPVQPTDTSHNLWGAEQTQHAVADTTPQVACSYTAKDSLRRMGEGVVLVSVPSFQVAWNDPLNVGDWVSNVQTNEGTVLLAGPAEVEEVIPDANNGPVVLKTATLRAVTSEQ